MAVQLAVVAGLGLSVPLFLRILPVLWAVISYFLLTRSVENVRTMPWVPFIRKNRLMERFLAIIILLGACGFATILYRRSKIDQVLLPPSQISIERNWRQFQSQFDFKVISGSGFSSDEYVYFEKGPGRVEQVQSALAKGGAPVNK